jgi:ergothioneine biosynthesis protein EgtB
MPAIASHPKATAAQRGALVERFRRVREASEAMCRSLEPAEFRLQPMDDVSPPWWNLGHTSWFFARNVLAGFGGQVTDDDRTYDYLLNSYYASLGERLPRGQRGSVTRPTTEEIFAYRRSVDQRVERLVETIEPEQWSEMARVLRIGIEHEQQHQELFYTEIKYILAQNPPHLRRSYRDSDSMRAEHRSESSRELRFLAIEGGLVEIGCSDDEWCWDNELPRHRYYVQSYRIADRLVTNREFLAFIDDGGYRNQLLWLDNGWQQRKLGSWTSPLYWDQLDGQWQEFTLGGMRRLALDEPMCHVSFYEAEAFIRWRSETFADEHSARLPSEQEWEHAARTLPHEARSEAFVESGRLHPAHEPASLESRIRELSGVVWQWTSSYYQPYPGYRPFPGALAEYNGKFMDNQRVLRGGSCVTPRDHFRVSYRNFWPAATRFQFTGLRLALDCGE